MIEAKTSRQGPVRVLQCELHGSEDELITDALYILRQIYRQMASQSRDGADFFADCIKAAVNGEENFELWTLEDPPGTVKIGTEAKGGGPS